MRTTSVTINLAAVQHNLVQVQRAAPGCRIMAAIKANAYGHGLIDIAHALADTNAFGVACLDEALLLRESGIRQQITLLDGFFNRDEFPLIERHALHLVIHTLEQIEELANYYPSRPIPVWVKVDTGMHRLGLAPEKVASAWQHLSTRPEQVKLCGLMTHLANADLRDDPMTVRQLTLFTETGRGIPGERSIANSAGILGWPTSHADWVRPGIMLYGVSPFAGQYGMELGLHPVMTFRSELIAVKAIPAGDTVGYGGCWRCPEDTKIGVVAAGYGDGYPRHVPNGTPVLVNGCEVPLVGRVSMDMLTVDLRSQPTAHCGDPVVLWGDGLPVERIADAAGTIGYELLCGIASRVRSTVIGAG